MVTLQVSINSAEGLDAEDVEQHSRLLFDELCSRDDIESVKMAEDKNPPPGHKSFGAWEVGALVVFLQAVAAPDVVKTIIERLCTKASPVPVTLQMSNGDKSVSITVKNIKDLEQAMKVVKDFTALAPH